MDIKYSISKFKNSNIQELKDSVSVEEPLEMRLKFKNNKNWETQNISITMRTPGNDEDLIRGFLFNERIIDNLNKIESIKTVKTECAKQMAKTLALEYGLFVGISAGANVKASFEWLRDNDKTHAITILCDRGERYLSCL